MTPVDPFDLPEWLGTSEVTWRALRTERGGHLIHGELSAPEVEPLACNLLAIDQAWPHALAEAEVRERVHLTWHNGEVDLMEVDGELTLVSPGSAFSSARVMLILERLARAVGAHPDHYVAAIRLGTLEPEA
ncbi:hypothetical protein [Nocardioides alcanivorans]|uniref:hypothetical protein n=1 Tax=Nocardioides alcanivorans TaxID=2897352 RepID=UPI001F352D3C|nr:hypothetical protein [Nocardioides alcanivorans]